VFYRGIYVSRAFVRRSLNKRQKARSISSQPLRVSQSVCLPVCLEDEHSHSVSLSVSQPARHSLCILRSHKQQPILFFNQSACLLVKHSHICQPFSQSAFFTDPTKQSYLQSYNLAVIYFFFSQMEQSILSTNQSVFQSAY
jgi:hypothetical protein